MVSLGLKVAAVVLFVIAAVPLAQPYHGSLVAAGLACYTLSDLVGAA